MFGLDGGLLHGLLLLSFSPFSINSTNQALNCSRISIGITCPWPGMKCLVTPDSSPPSDSSSFSPCGKVIIWSSVPWMTMIRSRPTLSPSSFNWAGDLWCHPAAFNMIQLVHILKQNCTNVGRWVSDLHQRKGVRYNSLCNETKQCETIHIISLRYLGGGYPIPICRKRFLDTFRG